MTVEKVWDELWVGAKDLSSWVIAGSLRNAFRGSVGQASCGCRALIDLGPLPGYRSPSNSEDRAIAYPAVRQWGLSFIVERETALDRRIRSQSDVQSLRPWGLSDR